ncbi:MAG: PTS system, mannitol-specific IIC component / PTS system, mannitol-specific IIB component / PTS system, mannitol-specific IIA component [uncultured Corynebacteriales bacterium]|uniref:PTS system, mannitol-specific IIC component / PTS system, mannitol-specific IIB component / PTS system, mannitol-specific IIA component n=1 Tax=uncultured Mycobacteriales bacterium TaxID=581187 RepID=A0A6J4ICT1_9ACTN|nr:MAG: PTS system, mannitol-specific IIC component / PTS system, mannitol-specific IIB component / PTS system, mannitol-specific IIA component [uncultured Corynebacteriales bacterium]
MSAYTPAVQGTGAKATVQRVGGFLASMVMPNIAAFLAWGLLTALFIPTGWLPNATAAQLVDPMINYLLPLLIGFTGGRLVHGQRGGVVGAIATMGVIVGAGVPMFLGAMIVGPAAAWVMKRVDGFVQDRTRPGFEMLVDNFTAAVVGGAAALGGLWGVGPVVERFADLAGDGVGWLVERNLLPLVSLIVEPAKVLFLNNALNHGVFGPLGASEVGETGKSVLFMLETNPGPGLGVLLAYLFFGPRALRASVPAAIAVQFLGGIHEIYFPYVLMKPKMLLAAVAGGAAGILVFLAGDAGLVATPAPGSIFAYGAVTPRGEWLAVFGGVFAAAAVSFVVGSALLGFGRGERAADDAEAELAGAAAAVREAKPARPQLTDDLPTGRLPTEPAYPHGSRGPST